MNATDHIFGYTVVPASMNIPLYTSSCVTLCARPMPPIFIHLISKHFSQKSTTAQWESEPRTQWYRRVPSPHFFHDRINEWQLLSILRGWKAMQPRVSG